MSTEPAAEKKENEAEEKPSRPKIPIKVILPALINTVFVLITIVFLVYTKFIFKRPGIHEPEERKKLEEAQKKAKEEEKRLTYFTLDPITVNIAPSKIEGETEARKLHYVNVGVAFETHGDSNKELLESLKPYILDQIITILGRKTFEQLSTIQGRYVLQFQIQDAVNQLVLTKLASPPRVPPVSHTFFNQLTVQ